MSADNTRNEWHLTPAGWVKGTSRYSGHVQGALIERPADALATWEEHLSQSSIYSETFSTLDLIWESPDRSTAEREALRQRFPEPFEGYSPRPLDRLRALPTPTTPRPRKALPLLDASETVPEGE